MMHEFKRVVVKTAARLVYPEPARRGERRANTFGLAAAKSSRSCANGADGISDIEGKVAGIAEKAPRFALDSVARKRISSNCSGTPEKDHG